MSSPHWPNKINKKSVGICIGYRPTLWGFSHCPITVGRQRRSPTLVYAIGASGYIPRGISCRMQDNYISTGIHRCSILDCNRNFARISSGQESARINAFYYVFAKAYRLAVCAARTRQGDNCIPPSVPRPRLPAVCLCKFSNNIWISYHYVL